MHTKPNSYSTTQLGLERYQSLFIVTHYRFFLQIKKALKIPTVSRKGFGSAVCDSLYTIYLSLIQTLFEAHIVLKQFLKTSCFRKYGPVLV